MTFSRFCPEQESPRGGSGSPVALPRQSETHGVTTSTFRGFEIPSEPSVSRLGDEGQEFIHLGPVPDPPDPPE